MTIHDIDQSAVHASKYQQQAGRHAAEARRRFRAGNLASAKEYQGHARHCAKAARHYLWTLCGWESES